MTRRLARCSAKTGHVARVRSWISGCLCLVLLGACAAKGNAPGPAYGNPSGGVEIGGVRIVNQLKQGVTEARILVLQSGNFVSCGNILPGTVCSTSFPGRAYEGGQLRITWKERGVAKATPDFVLKTKAFSGLGKALWIEVVIFAPGQAGAKLVLNEEAR